MGKHSARKKQIHRDCFQHFADIVDILASTNQLPREKGTLEFAQKTLRLAVNTPTIVYKPWKRLCAFVPSEVMLDHLKNGRACVLYKVLSENNKVLAKLDFAKVWAATPQEQRRHVWRHVAGMIDIGVATPNAGAAAFDIFEATGYDTAIVAWREVIVMHGDQQVLDAFDNVWNLATDGHAFAAAVKEHIVTRLQKQASQIRASTDAANAQILNEVSNAQQTDDDARAFGCAVRQDNADTASGGGATSSSAHASNVDNAAAAAAAVGAAADAPDAPTSTPMGVGDSIAEMFRDFKLSDFMDPVVIMRELPGFREAIANGHTPTFPEPFPDDLRDKVIETCARLILGHFGGDFTDEIGEAISQLGDAFCNEHGAADTINNVCDRVNNGDEQMEVVTDIVLKIVGVLSVESTRVGTGLSLLATHRDELTDHLDADFLQRCAAAINPNWDEALHSISVLQNNDREETCSTSSVFGPRTEAQKRRSEI